MASFRSPAAQAAKVVGQALALGEARHEHRDDGRIHSVGTARVYEQALTQAAEWLRESDPRSSLWAMTPEQAQAYLAERAELVGQKALDLDRQALQLLPNITEKLERERSALPPRGLAQQGRAYTPAQVAMVAEAQSARNALATEIAYAAGLRAHELYTLRPAAEQPASAHRAWSEHRFAGREGATYTVAGKGGLIREVTLPPALAERLEAQRRPEPQTVTDRGVYYTPHYAIGGGQAWSQSFTAASERALGWSTGAHGLRHSYAQARLGELQGRGLTYRDALATVSQELGHFRADITEVYLR